MDWRPVGGWVRCRCGRWADSEYRGQCWICAGRGDPSQPLSYRFTALLLAAPEAILHALGLWEDE